LVYGSILHELSEKTTEKRATESGTYRNSLENRHLAEVAVFCSTLEIRAVETRSSPGLSRSYAASTAALAWAIKALEAFINRLGDLV
jgi:hypothetical protein